MSTQVFVQILLPLLIAMIMWGLGLNLTIEDFKRIKTSPKPIYFGLFLQLLIIPMLAIALSALFKLPPIFSAGMLLLASSPGGPSANMLSHICKGNVALNISLTAINSIIAIVYLPFMMLVIVKLYLTQEIGFAMQYSKILQIVFILLAPMVIGMWMNKKNPMLSRKFEKYVNRLALIFLIFVVIFGAVKEHKLLMTGFFTVGPAVILFCIGSLCIGYWSSKAMSLNRRDTIAIVMELGVHSCTLTMGIALNAELFNSIEMAVPSALYAVFMYIPTGFATYLFKRNSGVKN